MPIDVGRSFPVSAFKDIARIPDVRLISLQKGHGGEQLDSMPAGMAVERLDAGLDTGPDAFLDTAAVIECLDLVITCDTAVAHLAGALGRPLHCRCLRVHSHRRRKSSRRIPRVRGGGLSTDLDKIRRG